MGTTDQIVQGRWGGILRKPISMSLFPTSFKIHWYSARHWVGGILYWIKFSPSAVSSLLLLIFPFPNPIDPQEGRAAHLSSFVFSFFFPLHTFSTSTFVSILWIQARLFYLLFFRASSVRRHCYCLFSLDVLCVTSMQRESWFCLSLLYSIHLHKHQHKLIYSAARSDIGVLYHMSAAGGRRVGLLCIHIFLLLTLLNRDICT